MRFSTTFFLGVVLAAASAMAQSTGGSAMPMNTSAGGGGGMGVDLSMIPPCFKACGQTAATSKEIGCQSAADFKCICSKPSFQEVISKCIMTSNDNDCPKIKTNTSAIESGVKTLQALCAQVTGSNASAGGMSGSMPGMNSSMPASGSGSMTSTSSSTNTSSMPKKNGAAAGLNVPAKELVASIAVVLSTLTIGAITLA